jgi:hypothetical protein
MFAKCSNVDCGAPFDYREGQLIRSCGSPLNRQSPADQYYVEHFWLCGSCSKLYVFEYQLGAAVKIKLRVTELRERPALTLVTVA